MKRYSLFFLIMTSPIFSSDMPASLVPIENSLVVQSDQARCIDISKELLSRALNQHGLRDLYSKTNVEEKLVGKHYAVLIVVQSVEHVLFSYVQKITCKESVLRDISLLEVRKRVIFQSDWVRAKRKLLLLELLQNNAEALQELQYYNL